MGLVEESNMLAQLDSVEREIWSGRSLDSGLSSVPSLASLPTEHSPGKSSQRGVLCVLGVFLPQFPLVFAPVTISF